MGGTDTSTESPPLLTVDYFLTHHGVEGMKWGRRKSDGEDSSTESATKPTKVQKASSNIDKQIAKHQAASADHKSNVVNLQSHLKDITENGANSEAVKAYYKHTINRSAPVFTAIHGMTKAAAARNISHGVLNTISNESRLAAYHDKQVAKLQSAKTNLSHDALDLLVQADEDETSMYHHGVLGMHWGKHEAEGDSSDEPKETDSTDSREVNRVKTKVSANGVNSLSNTELKALTNRLNLEKQYSDLTKQPPKKTALDSALAKANKVQAVYNQVNSPLAQLAFKGVKKLQKAATSDAGKAIASEVLKEA